MKKIFTLLATILLGNLAFSQTVDIGNPIGWNAKIPKLADKVTMPGFDLGLTQFEDSINDANKIGPWKFGHEYDVDLGIDNSGTWFTMPNGDRLWRLNISTPGATSQNFVFDKFNLPEGSYLMMYPTDKHYHHNAYTSINNNEAQVLGSAIIDGDNIIIEYFEPAAVAGQGELNLDIVVHGYREVKLFYNETEKALNSSGDCNIDVGCPLGIGWEDQINSVAMILTTSGLCTGALINNTSNDETPYFLTANHCGFSASWNFRFNWISPNPSCATTANSTDIVGSYDEINGCSLRANSAGSDMGLLELNSSPPCTYTPFYAGWDNSDATTVTAATGIHHPSGDIMKICREDNAPYKNSAAGAQVWYIDEWEQGVTEPGSSGSPLFDQNGRIIGQLYGGAAACSGTSNNGQYDYYGRVGVSWAGGGSASTRLSNWLDPTGSGATTNNGFDPCGATTNDDAGISSVVDPAGLSCGTTIDPSITLRNYGANTLSSVDINYDIDGGASSTFNWAGTLASGSNTTVILPTIAVSPGGHTLNVSTNNPNATADTDGSNDAGSTTFIIGNINVDVNITTDCWGSETTWYITEQTTGDTYVSGGPYTNVPMVGGSENSNFCLPDGCYTFHIDDSYGDGLAGNGISTCTVDGDYEVVDNDASTAVVTMPIADFGSGTTHDFCVGSNSVDELNPLKSVAFYPNPTNSELNILVPFNASNVSLVLTDLTGKIIATKKISSGNTRMELDKVASGLYLIQLSYNNYTVTKKIEKL
jgi:lysyl endopeptidase